MRSLITEPLGLYGWTKAEPVILAALLSEEPLLIVGPHGCAKSFVLERLAESLGMAFRLYNASLINYDDLVGVPLPDASRTKLEYLASPESIWDAQVVFIDEISRTRPELQNKLFPIIYDRRVQGRPLKRLVYRWAAMNPPPTEEELESDDALYLGSEPLDAALADRFPFIVPVPDWDALSEDDRRRVLTDQFAGRHEFPVDISALVAEAKARSPPTSTHRRSWPSSTPSPTVRGAPSTRPKSRPSARRRGTSAASATTLRSGASWRSPTRSHALNASSRKDSPSRPPPSRPS